MERSSKCAVCYSSFRALICIACVSRSLNECKTVLDSLKSRREVSYSRLSGLLVTKVTLEGHNKYGSGQYDQICNALLPQGLNPLSVPPKELAASLGELLDRNLSFPKIPDMYARFIICSELHNRHSITYKTKFCHQDQKVEKSILWNLSPEITTTEHEDEMKTGRERGC